MSNYSSYKPKDADDTLVVELTGKLDSSTSGSLFECIKGFIEKGERHILLDCSKLDAISSEGLATFVRAKNRLKERGGSISLVGVKGGVEDVLKMVHFDRLFQFFSSVDEAANSLQ